MIKGYVLKDPINNKIRYVGITSKELEYRLSQHNADAYKKDRMHWHKCRWIRSLYDNYGIGPTIHLVDIFETIEEAKSFEVNYIIKYKELYNLTNDTPGGDYVAYKSHTRESILKRKTIKKVCQYNIFGELLHTYEMIEDAVKALKLKSGSKITACCKKYRKHAHGYIWRYYNEDLGDISDINPNSLCFNNLLQYDLDGNLVNIWDSYKKASDSIGDNSKGGNIAACVNGNQHVCKGYIWKIEYKLERLSKNPSNSVNSNRIPSEADENQNV